VKLGKMRGREKQGEVETRGKEWRDEGRKMGSQSTRKKAGAGER
jgi:hypothetical protein